MKIRFILNPISGNKQAHTEDIRQQILAHFPQAQLCLTTGPGHATQLAQEAAHNGFEKVVAMGGDGTINETAKGLLHTQTALGIIPRGSGNGFAREIGMFLPLEKALAKLKTAVVLPCDAGQANGELFLNVAGVGIEAVVAWQFMEHAQTGRRGKWPYFTSALKTLLAYQPPRLQVTLDGIKHDWAPLTLVFANNRQYGSNFRVAPQARLDDGYLDAVRIAHVSVCKLAAGVPFFFAGKKPPFGLTQSTRCRQATIEATQDILYHIDGEPRQTGTRLEIKVLPNALQLWRPYNAKTT